MRERAERPRERERERATSRKRSERPLLVAAPLVAALLAPALLGCERGGPTSAALSWRFADGRPCDLAGIETVEIEGASARPFAVRCPEGLAPEAAVELEVAETPAGIAVTARSTAGAALYRGEAEVPASGGPVLVTLRSVGGE